MSYDLDKRASEIENKVAAVGENPPRGLTAAAAMRREATRLCGTEWDWDVVEGIGGSAAFVILGYRGRP